MADSAVADSAVAEEADSEASGAEVLAAAAPAEVVTADNSFESYMMKMTAQYNHHDWQGTEYFSSTVSEPELIICHQREPGKR
jgi:hypothetical protein